MEGFKELKGLTFSSLSPKPVENGNKGFKMEKPKMASKPSPQASVKGKKILARSRKTTNVTDSRDSPPDLQAANNALFSTAAPRCASPNGTSGQGAATNVQSVSTEDAKHEGGGSEDRACRFPCASELGLPTEVESMVDDASVDRSWYGEGRLCAGGLRVEGQVQSGVGMSIGGAGDECSVEDCSQATGLGLVGDGKAPMSY